ncbi:HAD family hydrolase [Pelagibacterales bacterium SAG-MED13]|nr:HAD family hydrolase [Pelagibacterales bacterium SAG-MED13]
MSKKKYSFLIFDLDGVIFDSKKNMEYAWSETCKEFSLLRKFDLYFKNVGLPFEKILINLKIKPSKKIYESFKRNSLKKIDLIKAFKGVKSFFRFLDSKKIKYSIVTSKDYKRSKYLLKRFKINPISLHSPNKKLRGKPYPDHILQSLKQNKVDPKKACYIGDTSVDYITAKRSKIGFIFATYGYGKKRKLYKDNIKKITDLKKYIN